MRYCFSKGRCGAGIGSTFGFFFDRELKLLGLSFFTSYLLVVYTQNLLPALIDILLGKIQLAATVEGSLTQFFGLFCNLNVFAPLVGIVRGRPCVMALYTPY